MILIIFLCVVFTPVSRHLAGLLCFVSLPVVLFATLFVWLVGCLLFRLWFVSLCVSSVFSGLPSKGRTMYAEVAVLPC